MMWLPEHADLMRRAFSSVSWGRVNEIARFMNPRARQAKNSWRACVALGATSVKLPGVTVLRACEHLMASTSKLANVLYEGTTQEIQAEVKVHARK